MLYDFNTESIDLTRANNETYVLLARKTPESTVSANRVTITKSETKIENVVITPNRINGVKDPNVKLKKPIAVVNDVKKTGLPISISWKRKSRYFNLQTFLILSKCIKSEIVIIKIIAGIIIITNSIPPNNKFEIVNENIIEMKIEIRLTKTSLRLVVK